MKRLVFAVCVVLHSFVVNLLYAQTSSIPVHVIAHNTKNAISVISALATSIANERCVPGFALGIVQGGRIIHEQCYGVRSLVTKAPVTPETVFQLGSLSKSITSALIGVLSQEKSIHLDDAIGTYVNTFQSHTHPIHLKHILSHSTGFERAGFNALIETERYSMDDMFSRLLRTSHAHIPGSVYDYHNVAYALLHPVVEASTGYTFEEALRYYLFDPLGMPHASASYEQLLATNNRAFPHQKTSKGMIQCKSYRKGYYDVAPAGGMNASLRDLCAFLIAQMGHKSQILSKQTLQDHHQPRIFAKDILERSPWNKKRFQGSFYGLGWRILHYEGHRIVFHGGWVKGFINIMLFLPDYDVGIVVLQNAETSLPWVTAMSFVDRVLNLPQKEWDRRKISPIQSISHKKNYKLKKKLQKIKRRSKHIKKVS